MTVTCDGHRLTYCCLHLYLQCHCGCSSSNPLSPMRTVSWVSCCAADDPCFVAYATEHTLAVGFGRQGRVHRKCKWVSGFPCTPEFNNVESIFSYSTLRSTSTMSDSSCRANPGADGEGTTSSSSMRENSVLRFLERAWLWRNPSSSPSSSLAMRVVGSRGCGASFELIDRS